MKKIFKNSLLLLAGLLIVTSCNKETTLAQPELGFARYEQLSKTLESDFNQVASELRDRNSNFSDKKSVLNAAEFIYGKESDGFSAFLNSFNNVSSSNGRVNNDLTAFQQQSTEEIISVLSNYSSLSEFQIFLDERFLYFSEQALEVGDKDFILSYIVSYKVSLDFVVNNLDLFSSESTANGRVQGWWSDWGKCVAGVLGGAGTGALTFGLAGAAIGTVALPVVGTVSAGAVGAIGGAIAGGLTGAAASCGQSK